jgi:competence protein ComEA
MPPDPPVELNRASQADLEALPGIGPALSERLLQERQRRAFSGWLDLVSRVKGVGWHGGLRLSRSGLRIEGQAHPEDRGARASDH